MRVLAVENGNFIEQLQDRTEVAFFANVNSLFRTCAEGFLQDSPCDGLPVTPADPPSGELGLDIQLLDSGDSALSSRRVGDISNRWHHEIQIYLVSMLKRDSQVFHPIPAYDSFSLCRACENGFNSILHQVVRPYGLTSIYQRLSVGKL